jgi:hypothetical protein
VRPLLASAALGFVIVGEACSRAHPPADVGVGPSLVFPLGLLQSVAQVVVREYYAGPAACNPTTGDVTGGGTPDATTTLSEMGCTGGDVWCGSMQITTSEAQRVFGAEADDASGNALAVGCLQAVVEESTQPITISMARVAGAAQCGDGVVQPTELCDPPGNAGDLVCDASCQTKEELVSAVNSAQGVQAPSKASAGDRTAPALAWPAGPHRPGASWPSGATPQSRPTHTWRCASSATTSTPSRQALRRHSPAAASG